MWVFFKCCCAAVFIMAALALPAFAVVGIGVVFKHWLGDTWYSGLLAAPFILLAFGGGIAFLLWVGERVGDWVIGGGEP